MKLNYKEATKFTDHQLQVLKAWSEATTVHQVANKFGITHHTVDTLLKRMRKKIGVHRTVDVYIYARNQGWI